MRLFLVILLSCASIIWAQPVITTNDIPSNPGTTITMMGNNTAASVNLGSSGANQTWNFTAMAGPEETIQEWISPVGTPFVGDFPNANRCMYSVDQFGTTEMYVYYNLTASDFLWLGLGSDGPAGTQVSVVDYTHEPGNFPFTYLDEWYSVWTMDVGSGITMVDSLYSIVDGWGTLEDITGTFQCLRVQNFHASSTWFMGAQISSFSNWHYDWIVSGRGTAVSIGSEIDEPNPNFTTGTFHRITDINTAVHEVEMPKPLPMSIILHPAYPNPFNPETNISFCLPFTGDVSVAVYDIMGREVSRLHDGILHAGTYRTIFDGSARSSGTYFVKLNSGSFQQTQSIVLTK